MMYQRSRSVVLGALVQVALAACSTDASDGDLVSSETQEIAGCSGTGFSLYQQLCGVGESGGRPAINFRGQWFRLDYDGTTWAVTNGVGASESAVAPTDTTTDSRPSCIARCPPPCTRLCGLTVGGDCVEQCNTRYKVHEHRRMVWSVAGQTFNLDAVHVIENQRTQNGGQDVRIGRNLTFTVTTNDPVDGNPWTLVAHPLRLKTDASDQFQANWTATEPSATTTYGDYNTLFQAAAINVEFTSQVEMMSAYKTGATGTSAMVARSNLPMNRALDINLPQASYYQGHFEPEALYTSGNVLSRVPDSGGIGAYDLNRFSQFFMDDRRGHAGYSSFGSGERPFAQSTRRDWTFHHNIRDYTIDFPFLAGICGFEVYVKSYIAGAFSHGRRACFDGVPVDVDMAGFLEFAFKAGGGFGCNILVASASAGLAAGIRARAEFTTSIDAVSVPPALTASVNVYSDVEYAAYFRVRVLFWTRKWEKTIGVFGRRVLFQKGASFRLASSHALPAAQVCAAGGTPAEVGTCADPEATCDVEGRCVRYDLASTGQPERVDTEQCTMPTCSTDPPLLADNLLNPFLPSYGTCAPNCGKIPIGLVNPDGSVCPNGTCDGLPAGFNRSLLTIPATAAAEILTSSDGGQRARVYRWTTDGTKKAVIEIYGVLAGASPLTDVENCARDFVVQRLTPTAVAVNARIRQLKAEGYAHHNILVRGHSLGSLDAYQVMDGSFPANGAGAGHGILLGVPLHVIIRINKMYWGSGAHPLNNSNVGIFVSPTDPVARGFPASNLGQWYDVWCKAKKGPGPGYNQKLPPHLLFNVVDTPSDNFIAGHFIGSYCRVARVTCFQGESLVRDTQVTLQASTGHFLAAESGGGGPVNANGTAAGPWEHFVIESAGPLQDGSQVYLRTVDSSHFLTHWPDFPYPIVRGYGSSRASNTTFTVVREAGPGEVRSGDRISLRSLVNGKFVAARNGGGTYLEINRGTAGPWEKFLILFRSGALPVQGNWRWCSKCQGMAHLLPGSVCPAGGSHNMASSNWYSLHMDVGSQPGMQDNWRWCSKCQGLAYGGLAGSVCPAGGSHSVAGSANYSLHINVGAQPGLQDNWRWCSKCQALAYGGIPGSMCPTGGSHSVAGSGNYSLPMQ